MNTGKLLPIDAGFATTGQGAGPFIVTERAGLFEKHGLQVKKQLIHGARGVVRGLMGGEIQFGNLAAPTLLRANLEEGADLAFLTGGINQQFLVGGPAVAHWKHLSDRTIGILGDGGLSDTMVDYTIKAAGTQKNSTGGIIEFGST